METKKEENIDPACVCNSVCKKLQDMGVPSNLYLRASFLLADAMGEGGDKDDEKGPVHSSIKKIMIEPFSREIEALQQEIERLRCEKLDGVNQQINTVDEVLNDSVTALESVEKESLSVLEKEGGAAGAKIASKIGNALKRAKNDIKTKVEKQKKEIDEIKKSVSIDTLTGFYNRKAFDEKITEVAGWCVKNKQDATFLLIDIDNLKRFNEIYGPEVGNVIIRFVAESGIKARITHEFKEGKMVFGRYGGDEFGVLLIGIDLDKATSIAESVRINIYGKKKKLVEEIKKFLKKDVKIYHRLTLSITVVEKRAGEQDPERIAKFLVKDAYQAMEIGERLGKSKNVVLSM
ncbi:MAG: diguanylate cyclase [Desulfobulbaceae bacterium]|nr:diguanylate cyclase [Desulfobulbaceae bacterium]